MKIKHFTVIAAFLITLLALSAGWVKLYQNCYSIDIEFETVSGDAGVIKNIAICGDIVNDTHWLSFKLMNDQCEKKFNYGDYNGYSDYDPYLHIRSIMEDSYYLTLVNNFYTSEIKTKIACKSRDINMMDLDPQTIGDTHYYLTVTDENHSGSGGLYTYDKKDGFEFIFPINLEGGNVKLLNFKAFEDKLIIIISRYKTLYALIYDTNTNSVIKELEIAPEKEPSRLYVNISNGFMILTQNHWTETRNGDNYINNINDIFYVLDINSMALENHAAELEYIYQTYRTGILNTSYKDGILYALVDLREERFFYDDSGRLVTVTQIGDLELFAFKNGQQVYEGNIVSNIKFEFHISSYDEQVYQRRYYYNMRIE